MATLSAAKRLVVKIGSALLVDRHTGDLRADWLHALAEDVRWLKGLGCDVVLVSSGSIALGRGVLGLPATPLALEQSQAAAAVGQIRLARAYEEALAPHAIKTAQVLVTLEDSADRRRYLNSRATLETLLGFGVVPIVNENDTVATDVDGFYSANPNEDASATRYDVIDTITAEIEEMAGDAGSGLSKGGMKTKLMAAKTATTAGCAMAITEGSVMRPLRALEDGANATWFTAQSDPQAARKRWIAAMKPRGSVTLDAGAVSALTKGKSLLPAGITEVSGPFERGDSVALLDPTGRVIGSGLSRYASDEAAQIKGHQSAQIEALLGYPGRAALIHRDDMAL